MLRISAAVAFLFIASPANAFTCEEIRQFVAQHGRAAAIAVALKHGATWRQINEARKCLPYK